MNSYIIERNRQFTLHDIPCVSFFYSEKSGKKKVDTAKKFLAALEGTYSEFKGEQVWFDKDKKQIIFDEKEVLALTSDTLGDIFRDYLKAGGKLSTQFIQVQEDIANREQNRVPTMVL